MKIGKLIRNEYPIRLTVDIHDYCNANCKICPYASLKGKLNQGRMDWSLYTKIVDDFSSLMDRYRFQGTMTYCNMGEPFIENNLAKYTHYAEENDVFVYLNTNASLMTPQKIDMLISSGFKGAINISFHAASADLYRTIMGLEIENTKNNFLYLLQHYPKEKIYFNVINCNWPAGEEQKIRSLFQQWEINLQINNPISRVGLVFHRKRCIRHIAGCGPERVLYQMVICHNGDVLLCCNDMSRKEVMGNLTHSSIQDVWNGDIFKRYLQEIYLGKKSAGDMICHLCEESVPYWSLRCLVKSMVPDGIITLMQNKNGKDSIFEYSAI